jgi:cobalt/nickel transport system permease protein
VLVAGAVVTAAALSVALRRLEYEQVPRAAVLAAAFFVASLVKVPVGPASAHLLLNGLMGLMLGWAAVPAVLVGLVLQAAFFGYGGILSLGVNTMNLALPALVCALLFRPLLTRAPGSRQFWLGAAAGALAVVLTGLMVSAALTLSGEGLAPAARAVLALYLPLALVEAAVTGAAASFLGRVAPEVFLPLAAHED